MPFDARKTGRAPFENPTIRAQQRRIEPDAWLLDALTETLNGKAPRLDDERLSEVIATLDYLTDHVTDPARREAYRRAANLHKSERNARTEWRREQDARRAFNERGV